MTASPRPVIRFSLMCIAAVSLSVRALPAQELDQEEWKRYLDKEYPEVPTGLLSRYLDGIRVKSMYRLARSLETSKVEKEAAEWSKSVGLTLKPVSWSFIEFLTDDYGEYPPRVVIDGKGYQLFSVEKVEVPPGLRIRLVVLGDNADPG